MIPKRNKLLDITEANQILLFNSNHCKFLLINWLQPKQELQLRKSVPHSIYNNCEYLPAANKKSVKCCCGKHSTTKSAVHICNACWAIYSTKIVVLPSEQQNPQLFQQPNNSLFPQNHTQFPNKNCFATNEQPVSQLRSQPTVLLNNLQIYQSKTAPNFPASLMPFGANVPNFVDSETQSNAKQNQIYYPNIEPSNLIVNNSQASASNANFNPDTQLTNLDYKHSIKLPPLKLQNFNGDPLHFNEWINNFYSMIHHNPSITDTHRITYPQNSVSGKAKDLIHAYSCDPSYYQTALNVLINHFGDRTIVVIAFINQLEN